LRREVRGQLARRDRVVVGEVLCEESNRFAPVSFADAAEAVETADLAVIATPWEEYTDAALFAGTDLVLVDLWRCFSGDAFESVDYRPFGKGELPGRNTP
jgi:predicted dinucleotide-binding enzyme